MQALLFAETTKKTLADSLAGSSFTFAKLTQGDTMTIGLRWCQKQGSKNVEVTRTLLGLRASIGPRDARPERGQTRFQIGNPATTPAEGTNLTAVLSHNFTAGDLQAALNALSAKPGVATVEEDKGTFIIAYAAATSHTTLTARNNRLGPISVADVDYELRDGDYLTTLRLKQAPAAFIDAYEAVLPPPPSVTRIQAGFSDESTTRPEVQKIFVPSTFRGTYILKREGKESGPLTEASESDTLEAALAAIADTGGVFEVDPLDGVNASHVTFGGDMAGLAQDLIEIEVIVSPPGDPTFVLDLGRANMAAMLRGAKNGEVKLPLEIEASFENEADDSKTDVITFPSEVTIVAEITLAALALPANLDFLRPPSPVNYQAQGEDQVASGYHRWSGPRGNGSSTVFVIDHNLASELVLPVIRQNSANGEILRLGTDYDLNLNNANSLTVTMKGDYLSTPPATDELLIYILAFGLASQYDAHSHSIAEVTGLQAILDAHAADIAALTALAPSGSISSSVSLSSGPSLEIALPDFVLAYPSLNPHLSFGAAKVESLAAVIAGGALPSNGGLLPAVHDVAAETLTVPVPDAADSYKGRVFRHAAAASVDIDGGYGRKSVTIRTGEFVACDGRSWYPVKRYDASTTTTPVPVAAEADDNIFTAVAHPFADDNAIMFESPANQGSVGGVFPQRRYYVRDKTTDGFKIADTVGGTAINVTADIAGWTAFLEPKSTFYSQDMELELFVLPVKAKQFRIGQTLTIFDGIETAIANVKVATPRGNDWRSRDQVTKAQWTLVMRWGAATSETSPATTAANLKGITWNATPILEQRIDLVSSPIVHSFGCRIKRTADATFTVEEILYGKALASSAPINVADLYIGAWLERFDTEDGVSDPRGLALVMGSTRTNSSAPESGLGKLVIK